MTIAYPIASMSSALPLLRKFFKDTPRPVAVPRAPVDPQSNAARDVLRRLRMIG